MHTLQSSFLKMIAIIFSYMYFSSFNAEVIKNFTSFSCFESSENTCVIITRRTFIFNFFETNLL
jgi:hypothetical protein